MEAASDYVQWFEVGGTPKRCVDCMRGELTIQMDPIRNPDV